MHRRRDVMTSVVGLPPRSRASALALGHRQNVGRIPVRRVLGQLPKQGLERRGLQRRGGFTPVFFLTH